MKRRILGTISLLATLILTHAWSPAVADSRDAVALRNLAVSGDMVSGDLVNTSDHLVRDVRLLVKHTWLWDNERFPGPDSPGRAAYHTIPETIPPGGRLSFNAHPDEPLPMRPDGRFEPSVEIVGFTEIGY